MEQRKQQHKHIQPIQQRQRPLNGGNPTQVREPFELNRDGRCVFITADRGWYGLEEVRAAVALLSKPVAVVVPRGNWNRFQLEEAEQALAGIATLVEVDPKTRPQDYFAQRLAELQNSSFTVDLTPARGATRRGPTKAAPTPAGPLEDPATREEFVKERFSPRKSKP